MADIKVKIPIQTNSIEGFTILDYIEGISSTNIHTNIKVNGDNEYKIDFQMVQDNGSIQDGYVCYSNDFKIQIASGYIILHEGNITTGSSAYNFGLVGSNRHIITISKTNIQFDNATPITRIYYPYSSEETLTLIRSSCKLFQFEAYNRTKLLGSFVPVQQISNGDVGLYDIATEYFYKGNNLLPGNPTERRDLIGYDSIDKYDGLMSVYSNSQSSGQNGDIYYGLTPSNGDVECISNKIDLANRNLKSTKIYVNDNIVHSHEITNVTHSVLDNKIHITLSDILDELDLLEYPGYNYTGTSTNAYNMLQSILSQLGFDNPKTLEDVETQLRAITIEKPFLPRDTYRATIEKFCQLAQMQAYLADDGVLKFKSARPLDLWRNQTIINNSIELPPSQQLSQLSKDIAENRKYTRVDIAPTQIFNEDSTFTNSTSNPSDKELTDTIIGIVNNPNLRVVSYGEIINGAWTEKRYYEGIPYFDIIELDRSEAKIEVFYLDGYIDIAKPTDSQFLSFTYSIQMSGRNYTNIDFTYDWINNTDSVWAYWKGTGLQSNHLYTSASVPDINNTDYQANWSGSTITDDGSDTLTWNYMAYDRKGSSAEKPQSISQKIETKFSTKEYTDYYRVNYSIPVGFFMANNTQFSEYKDEDDYDEYTSSGYHDGEWHAYTPMGGLIRQADSLTISITANTLSFKQMATTSIGTGDSVYTYNSNELLAISANENIENSQYYQNAQNIINDYSDGVKTASIDIVCGNSYNISNDLIRDWNKGEIPSLYDTIKINDEFYKIIGREFIYRGVPKIKLELEEIKTGGFVHLNFTGMDSNGNLEGQQAFDGNIVAYAVGKPEISTSGDVETITYPYCNGLDGEYYGEDFSKGYDSFYSMRNKKVVEDTIYIPSTYNGKPVTKILNQAFRATNNAIGQEIRYWYQSIFIKNVIIGSNINEIGDYALNRIGEFYVASTYPYIYPRIYLPKSTHSLGSNFAGNATIYVKSDILAPSSGSPIYENAIAVVFENTVKSIEGQILYNSNPPLVFKHGNSDEINIDINSLKTATAITIYTDNTYVANYDWASKNITATIKPLSEWEE